MRLPHLPKAGLVNEALPGGDILQRHEVVDILHRVLEIERHSQRNPGGQTVWKIAHGVGPQPVTVIRPKRGVEMVVL